MSIATVITHGFGDYSTVNYIPTLGFGDYVEVATIIEGVDFRVGNNRAEFRVGNNRAEFGVEGQ